MNCVNEIKESYNMWMKLKESGGLLFKNKMMQIKWEKAK